MAIRVLVFSKVRTVGAVSWKAAIELSRLIERLASLAPGRKIDWSDSWSDEDLRDFRAASLRRLEATESEDMD